MNANTGAADAEVTGELRGTESVKLAPAEQLEQAFQTHQRELLGSIYHLIGNAEDARDALQDAFIKCWKHRDSLAEIVNLKAWIFHVALNSARDLRTTAWRRRRQGIEAAGPNLSAKGTSPEGEAVHAEEVERLRIAIAELRAEEQEVFLLRQNGDLTYEQIADQLGVPVGTVKTRMRMALEKLRSVVANNE